MREGRIGFDEKLEVGQATDSEKLRESLSPTNASQSRQVQHNDQYLRPSHFRSSHLSASPPPNDPAGHKQFDTEDLSRLLSKSSVHDGMPLGKEKFTSESWNDNVHVTQTYEEEGDICEQCRLEEMHMSMLRQKADEERVRHEEAERKARQLELEMQEKERRVAEETERKRKELKEHIDEINRQLMAAKKAQKETTPVQDTNNFLWNEERDPKLDALRKTDYREFLEKQMEENQRKKAEQADFERSMMTIQSGGKSNLDGSGSRIEIREEDEADSDAREARVQAKAKDMARKQLEFQAELTKRRGHIPREESWMWWAERPDEHGWREARMKAKNDQIDRNLQMKNAIVMLEDFKRRQAEEDKANREARMAKYEKLREQASEEASKLSMSMKRRSRPIITPDPRVEAAWKEAHEKTDRRYRLLQDGDSGQSQGSNQGQSQVPSQTHGQSQDHSSAGPSFVDVNTHTSCRRCIRCSRPLERRAKHSVKVGESIQPTALTWYPK